MNDYLFTLLRNLGVAENLARPLVITAGIVILAVLALLAALIARRLILRFVNFLIERSTTKWDDVLLEHKVFNRLALLAPALVIYRLAPLFFGEYPTLVNTILKLSQLYMVFIGLLVISGLINAAYSIYQMFETSKQVPLKGFFQVIKMVLYCITGIIVLSILLDQTPLYLLSGLGALTAVLLIVFKDPILGFVAGIQLSANKMVAIGDWIAMPSHGADGDVIEVALTTVKVKNWDKTITTIPTYDLISRSFKNWRGMQESGGRRIKRGVSLDLNSIRFCTEEMLTRFAKIQHIKEYLESKQREVAEYNQTSGVDDASLVNGRRLTNIGTFRAYVVAYLKNHPRIKQDMTFLIRQLAPGATGLPLEIYVFADETAWVEYEAIQADIFDHILAVIPEFDLRIFQEPTGLDFQGCLTPRAKTS